MKRIITEEFKLLFWRFSPIIFILIFIPLISYGLWVLSPTQELEILVVDKTVPDDTYREHHAIYWVLEHLKIQNKDNEFYDKNKDYWGFYPDGSSSYGKPKDLIDASEEKLSKVSQDLDILYFADTYGVFENDFENNQDSANRISKKIYGGLNRGDITLLRKTIAQKKTVIAEFNTMASPTPRGIRSEFENLMGIKWTGWIARYFDEMDTTINLEIPEWFISQFVKQHDNSWVSSGPGIVFVHENGRVEAFSDGVDYRGETPKIITPRINQHGFKLPETVPYPDWFDIVLIERDYQVISYYDISPSDLGKEKLKDMGLPRFFPASVTKNIGEGQFYYFAGDFSDMQNSMGSPKFWGLPVLWRGFHVASDYTDRESFYWNYFYPLLSEILERKVNEK